MRGGQRRGMRETRGNEGRARQRLREPAFRSSEGSAERPEGREYRPRHSAEKVPRPGNVACTERLRRAFPVFEGVGLSGSRVFSFFPGEQAFFLIGRHCPPSALRQDTKRQNHRKKPCSASRNAGFFRDERRALPPRAGRTEDSLRYFPCYSDKVPDQRLQRSCFRAQGADFFCCRTGFPQRWKRTGKKQKNGEILKKSKKNEESIVDRKRKKRGKIYVTFKLSNLITGLI